MTDHSVPAEQLSLLHETVRRARRPKPSDGQAPERPVARVVIDVGLAHLDRPFDYLVPEQWHTDCVPGCRVKVRFAGRDVDGYVIERRDDTDHVGRLSPIRRVVSAEAVLTPAVREVARLVADRYAGVLADVLRLAVPPRHARVEREEAAEVGEAPPVDVDGLAELWGDYDGGPGFVQALARGASPRAVWAALPGTSEAARPAWADQVAAAAAAAWAGGRGALILAPDVRDVERLDLALTERLGPGQHVVLTADLGPAARYRAFLKVLRGQVRVVVGTRAAALAPVHNLGLVAAWDDGDDLYAEPRAPYPHAREVLLLRAYHEGCGVLLGGHAISAEAAALTESGWARAVVARRDTLRARVAQVKVAGDSDHDLARDTATHATRMPRAVFDVVRTALADGPVLVHAPRYGYHVALACSRCRAPARCRVCTGALRRISAGGPVGCRVCGQVDEAWACPACDGTDLRAPVVGSLRTAEEWGRAFPSIRVISSGGDHVVDTVADEPAVVIATPGAEPHCPGGYAAAVLMDTWLTLGLDGLRASDEAMRRWLNVVALVRGAPAGGRVVAVGDPEQRVLQALVRWDPLGFALRELADRTSARLPPAVRIATITAHPDAIDDAVGDLDLPPQAQLLGPVPLDDEPRPGRESEPRSRAVIRTGRARGGGLSRSLQHLQAGRSARKLTPVRVQIDPVDLA